MPGVSGPAAILVGSTLLALLVAFLVLARSIGPSLAFRGLLGSWPWVFDRRIAALTFYQKSLGIDEPWVNLGRMLAVGAGTVSVVSVIYLAALARRRGWGVIAFVVVALIIAFNRLPWSQIARPWPAFLAVIASVACLRAWRRRDLPSILRATVAVFSLGLLAKMVLNARIAQYGFVLAMPAGVVLAELLTGTGPRWIAERSNGSAAVARIGGGLLVAATIVAHVRATLFYVGQKTVLVGSGVDRLWAEPRGFEVEAARRVLSNDPGTLAVVPQGLMLNYLTRRTNPSRYPNLMPPEMLTAGEPAALASLRADPPAEIVAVRKDADAVGFVLTEGRYEYGGAVLAWIKADYTIVGELCLPPGVRPELGLLLLRHR